MVDRSTTIPPGGLGISAAGERAIHLAVELDRQQPDQPNPDAIRRAAEENGLPVDRITKVNVLDPYFYK